MAKVKVNGSAPGSSPKAVGYADIKDQGRIPYGKTAPAPMANTDKPKKMTVRGGGAAIRGTSYIGYPT
jgi:hypothetical protein|tara:strand:- start:738 stop:941 length:204 start_codon:yes stop_codon:yes gene_type:complete